MPTQPSPLHLPLFQAVLRLPDTGLACADALPDLPAFVAAEIGGLAHLPRYRRLRRHLALCPTCGERHASLLETAMVEEQGRLPAVGPTKAPDLSFLDGEGEHDRE